MVTPPAEHPNGAPYWGEGHGGVPDDEARDRIPPQLPITMEEVRSYVRARTGATFQMFHLGQPADDIVRATVGNSAPRPSWFTEDTRMEARLLWLASRGYLVDASGSTLVHRNAGGVHVASRPSTNVYVAPGGELSVAAAAGFLPHMTAGGASGGGLSQPLLLFSDPVGASGSGTINEAPWSSQDGVGGYYGPLGEAPYLGGRALAATDFFPGGDEGTPYLGGGELTATGFFPGEDGEPPYLGGRELAVTDFFPGGDEGTPYLGGRALAATDFFPGGDEGTPNLVGRAPAVTHVLPGGHGGNPYLGGGALNPSVVGDGGGANARDQHVIDMPLALHGGGANARDQHVMDMPLAQPARGAADRGRKYLEKLLFNFLPASVIALGPLSGASDSVKLATYIILAVLVVLLVVGISTGACAKHVVRLSTCAAIFAMTVFVSLQLSRGIHIAVAALVGVALSGITLAV